MRERAYAKINLCLNVKKRRDDGYHELEMIMLPVSYYDEIELREAKEMKYSSNRAYLRFDDKNTIVKAVEYMKNKYAIKDNFSIHINKFIPTRAGLAGGSSDGACIIRMLDEMYKLNMSYEEKKEASLAIGADVFFCLMNKPALVKGIGEELEFFHVDNFFNILLVKPKEGVSTKEAFKKLNLEICDHPDAYALKKALIEKDYPKVLMNMQNSLESSSFEICPSILKLKTKLEGYGFDHVLMSGSGSTLIAISKDVKLVNRVMKQMRNSHYFAAKVKILS